MRSGIRQRLAAELPEIEGRVLESHEDGLAADKPYVVLVQGEETGINDWTGYGRIYEAWPCVQIAAGFEAVDTLADAIVRALDGRTISDADTGEVFTCRYEGTAGTDVKDETRDALTRGLRFSVAAIEPAERTEAVAADPWLEALAAWTRTTLGPEWKAYVGKWPADYAAPAVLWRLVGIETADGNAAAVKIRKQATGHALGRSPNEQTDAVLRMAEGLKRDGKIALDEAAKTYVAVQECAAMTDTDALRWGQLSVTLMRRSARWTGTDSPDAAPLMREVFYDSIAH